MEVMVRVVQARLTGEEFVLPEMPSGGQDKTKGGR